MNNKSLERETVKIESMVEKFRKIQSKVFLGTATNEDFKNASLIAEVFISLTRETYDRISMKYVKRRKNVPNRFDRRIWDKLLTLAKSRFNQDHNIRILDIGTAYGRDIKYASRIPNVSIIGIDNSDVFIKMLEELEEKKEIPSKSFLKRDMRDLSCFADESFEVVRHNATLVHLPVISKSYTVDLSLQESYRVLRKNGLLYVSVKEGSGIQFVDMKEGFGKILYQFYTMDLICSVLKRNEFNIISTGRKPSSRGKDITWLSIISEKKKRKIL